MRGRLVFITSVVACTQPIPDSAAVSSATVASSIPIPAVSVSGCRVRHEGRCTLLAGREATLDLWIDQPLSNPVIVTSDAGGIEARIESADGGQHVRLQISPAVTRVDVQAKHPRWTRPVTLELQREAEAPGVAAAKLLVDADRLDDARAELHSALPTLAGVDELDALVLLRNVEAGSGEGEAALDHSARAYALAERLGRHATAANEAGFAVFSHASANANVESATQWLEKLERSAARDPPSMAQAIYNRGIVAFRRLDSDEAIRSFQTASRLFERYGNIELVLAAAAHVSIGLAVLGRGEEARAWTYELLARTSALDLSCTERVRLRQNIGWAAVVLAQSGLDHDPPGPLFEAVLDDTEGDGGCPDAMRAANARISLALARLIEDEPEEAWAVLAPLDPAELPPYADWIVELRATAALQTGRLSEVPEFDGPLPTGDPTLAWLASLRQAQTLERAGLWTAAIDRYLATETALDRAVHGIGIDAGQESFLAGRVANAQALVELLLALGRPGEALCRTRLAIARAARSIDRASRLSGLSTAASRDWAERAARYAELRAASERDAAEDWQFTSAEVERRRLRRRQHLERANEDLDHLLGAPASPQHCDRLAPPTATHPLLVAFPSRDYVWLFAGDGHSVEVQRVAAADLDDIETWSTRVTALAPMLAEAQQIAVIASGRARAVPFHALRMRGQPLLAQAPVVYSLDLEPSARPDSPDRRALVVADPSETLAQARLEAQAVASALQRSGFEVDTMTGAGGTRIELAQRLADTAWFHYAGHGEAGARGFDARLLLADNTSLGCGDILTLERVPTHVVLSGCYTGAIDPASLSGGMNLGRAFVLAGAQAVVVADGEVDDDLARRFAEHLYGGDAQLDLVEGVRRAQLALMAEHPESRAWAAFRTWVP